MTYAPCRKCVERHMNCHSHCQKYAEYKKQHEVELNNWKAYKQEVNDMFSYKASRTKPATSHYIPKNDKHCEE